MNNKIKIIVAGKSNTGKSTIIYLINELLKNKGIECDIHIDERHEDNYNNDNLFKNHIDDRINAINKKSQVKIYEADMYDSIECINKNIVNRDIDPYGEEDWGYEYKKVEKLRMPKI